MQYLGPFFTVYITFSSSFPGSLFVFLCSGFSNTCKNDFADQSSSKVLGTGTIDLLKDNRQIITSTF